jgi:hypothetical protein
MTNVILTWDDPTTFYGNYGYTEIWSNVTDNLGAAIIIGTAYGFTYADAIGPGEGKYYWVRFRSKADVVGPYNAIAGTRGDTAPDVPYLLDVLTDQITQTQLHSDLGARIDLIDADSTVANSVAARVAAARLELGDSLAAVSRRVSTIETYDTSVASALENLIASGNNEISAISAEQVARTGADEALTKRIDTLTAVVGDNIAAVSSEVTARTNADSALGSRVDSLFTSVGNAVSRIDSEATARASADGALTTTTTALTARLNDVGGVTLEQKFTAQANALTGLYGQYTVKIDNNGYVSGFGLASTGSLADGFTSAFEVRADKFIIAPTVGSVPTSNYPFFVLTSATTINGTLLQPGTYLQAAFITDAAITNAKIGNLAVDAAKIANATITTAKIQDLAVTSAKIQDASITTAKIADAQITNAKIANVIQSNDFATGVSGWKIDKGGSVEFSTGVFRGELQAATGNFVGSLNAADITGATGTFAGSLYGADISGVTGNFSGTLYGANISGATGTFSGSLSAGVVDVTQINGTILNYETVGTSTFTMPYTGTIRFTGAGGGGGGQAGYAISSGGHGGYGGAAGQFAGGSEGVKVSFTNVALGSVVTIAVGAGGTAGTGSASPGAGGATTIYVDGSPVGAGSFSYTLYGGSGGSTTGPVTYLNYHTNDYGDGGSGYSGASGGGSFGGKGGGQDRVDYTVRSGTLVGLSGKNGTLGGGGGGGAPSKIWVNSRGFYQDPIVGDGGPGATLFPGGAGGTGYLHLEYFNPNTVVLRGEFDTYKSATDATLASHTATLATHTTSLASLSARLTALGG